MRAIMILGVAGVLFTFAGGTAHADWAALKAKVEAYHGGFEKVAMSFSGTISETTIVKNAGTTQCELTYTYKGYGNSIDIQTATPEPAGEIGERQCVSVGRQAAARALGGIALSGEDVSRIIAPLDIGTPKMIRSDDVSETYSADVLASAIAELTIIPPDQTVTVYITAAKDNGRLLSFGIDLGRFPMVNRPTLLSEGTSINDVSYADGGRAYVSEFASTIRVWDSANSEREISSTVVSTVTNPSVVTPPSTASADAAKTGFAVEGGQDDGRLPVVIFKQLADQLNAGVYVFDE